jgi:CheY-like chemotaxis protein
MKKAVEKKRILLVDDEAYSTEGYRLLLQKDGFVVESVTSGYEALHKIKSDFYDVVIANLLIPGKDALELINELKNKNITNKVIAISESSLISANNYPELVRHFGVTDVLEKPFSLELLLQKVHKKLEL